LKYCCAFFVVGRFLVVKTFNTVILWSSSWILLLKKKSSFSITFRVIITGDSFVEAGVEGVTFEDFCALDFFDFLTFVLFMAEEAMS
jgi:hypothetical protein